MKVKKIMIAMALVGTLGLSLMGTAAADGTAVVSLTPTVIAGDIITLQADVSDPHGLWLVAVYIDGNPDPLTNGALTISSGGTFYKPSTWGPEWANWPNFISWGSATTGSFTYAIDTHAVGTHVVELLMGSYTHDTYPWDGDFIPVGSFTVQAPAGTSLSLSPTTVEARGECSFPVTLGVNLINPHGLWLVAVYIDGNPDPLTNGTLTISTGGTFNKPSTWGPDWANWPNFISWGSATTGSFTYTIDTSNIPVGTHVVKLLMGSYTHDTTPWDGDFIPVGSFTVVTGSRTAICAPAGVRITDNVNFDYISDGTPREFDVPPLVWYVIQGNAFNITGLWKWEDAFLWGNQGVILREDSAPHWSLDGNTLTYTVSQPTSQGDFVISHPLYGQKKLVVDFDFTKIGIEPGMVGEIVLKMYSSTPSMIEERLVKPVYGQFRTIYNMNTLSPGVYYLKIILRNTQGIQLSKKYLREFIWWPAELGQFSWLGSTAGATDEVLAPWTPIGVESLPPNLSVNVWGRAYRFANSPLPAVIETKGKSILAAPIKVIAKVNGVIVSWIWSSYTIETQSPSVMRFNQQASGQGLRLSAVTQIEYDGMMRVDLNVTAEQPLTLEELIFEVPVQEMYAKYIYNQGHLGKSGYLPSAGLITGFEPLIWLGDEELGLQWFCESEKDWYNVNPAQCIEVLPQGGVVNLRLHLVDEVVNMTPGVRVDYGMGVPVMEPRTQVKELSYTFGLQAAPVKPVTKDVWDYRFAHLGAGSFDTGMTRGTGDRFNVPATTLDSVATTTMKTIAFHEHWTDIYGSTSTPYETELRNLVTNCHNRGINLLLYLGLLMSDISPEWTLFNEECLVMPRNQWDLTNYPPMSSQYAYNVCNASVWQDIEVDGLARRMMGVSGYGIDGVYLDSPDVLYSGCKNYLHGCGFIDPNGNLHRTYPIFGNRQKMRRVYAVVKGNKPEGQVNLHNSTTMSIPTLSWATSYWNGEHLGYRVQARGLTITSPFLERLPLDQFRTEFMGHQWGVPAEFLEPTLTGEPREALAMSLLHDVFVRVQWVMAPIWKLMDEFGRKASEWIPYWRNSGYVTLTTAGTDTYMSLYTHPANGMLGVISNLSELGNNVGVQLNLVNLNLVGATSAHVYEMMSDQNVLIENVIGVTNGYFTLNLPSRSWRLIWVKQVE